MKVSVACAYRPTCTMPLYLTSSHSSRVQKPTSLRRLSSSPFSAAARTKVAQRSKTLASALDDDSLQDAGALDATGKILSVISNSAATSVLGAIDHVPT